MVVMKKFQLSIQQDHQKQKTCKICKEKHPRFTFKRKSKSSNDGTGSNDPTVKSNCAGVGCATSTFSQVISMCVVPVRVKHSDSRNICDCGSYQQAWCVWDEDFNHIKTSRHQ